MWQQSVFDQMVDVARQDCTFATFTAAGFVRRGLITAGFEVKKVKGYRHKREMLVGHLPATNSRFSQQPYFERSAKSLNKIAIIGGGIASVTLAYSFAKRGISTTLLCKDSALAMGASHNYQGAIYPNLQADFNATSEFFAHSFYYTKRALMQLNNDGFHFEHDWCGVLLHAISETRSEIQQRLIQKQAWPSSLIRAVDQQQANEIAGIELPFAGLYIEHAGWVNPPSLVDAYWQASNHKQSQDIELNCEIKEFYKTDDGYILIKADGSQLGPFSQVIVTCGELSAQFAQTSDIPLRPARGQVTEVSENSLSAKLKTVLCHKGYFTPALDGLHSMGATFEKNSFDRSVTAQGDITNYKQLTQFYPTQLGIEKSSVVNAKAAIRATTPDHQPIVGQVPEQATLVDCFAPLRKGKFYDFKHYYNPHSNLYIFSGLGARGLCTAPLAAEMLVAELCGEPLPVPNHISEFLHPNRFIIRNLRRSKL
jgi:tRNA 5-methylaminomethyl-2-thiouridine biosynthesis bifunctional protein